MREPALRQAGPEKAPAQVRKDVSGALPQSKISAWQEQIEPLADRIVAALPPGRPVELVSEVLQPWSLAVTTVVLGLDAARARQLAALAPYLSASNASLLVPRRFPKELLLAIQRRVASARLKRLLRSVRVPGVQSLFLGLSQTLPEFLASAWLGLLENPSQLERLRAEPHLMPKAIEELLRYSGPVHTLERAAEQTVELAGVTIAEGERVILKVALANRDPEHFPDPNSLDVARRDAGHLALGGGPHSCVGALLVRMAAISATRAFAEKLPKAELIEPVVWRHGSTLGSPHSLRVRYGQLETSQNEKIIPSS
ncbi:MAG: cytochrome P450 [Acidobacteriia bacterium]|nr:cytochrome P450 [Terriglobia bacterium]